MTPKIVIIGIDGATFDSIMPLAKENRVPYFQRLISRGVWGYLKSTYPPLSPPAWISFMTGKNPGMTGIYHFWRRNFSNYNYLQDETLVTSNDFSGDTFLDYLGNSNIRIASIGLPMTYPAWKINGIMISGFPAPSDGIDKYYPRNLPEKFPYLNKKLDKLILRADKFLGLNEDEEIKILSEDLTARTEITIEILKNDDFDVVIVVFNTVDLLHHHFQKHTDPNFQAFDPIVSPRYSNVIKNFYIKIDDSIGKILECLKEDSLIFLMSDHGNGFKATKYFNINAWLKNNDYLKIYKWKNFGLSKISSLRKYLIGQTEKLALIRKYIPKSFKGIAQAMILNTGSVNWKKTEAFWAKIGCNTEGIVINVEGRQPLGCVNPKLEYEKLRNSICKALREVKDPETGKSVFINVYKREDIYSGIFLSDAPDIILELDSDYDGGSDLNEVITQVPLSTLKHRSGDHKISGIFLARGSILKEGFEVKDSQIIDLTPTILYSLGFPIPNSLDGKLLNSIFKKSYIKKTPIEYKDIEIGPTKKKQVLSIEEEKKIEENLKGIGYL